MKTLIAYLLIAIVLLSGCTPTPDPTPPPTPTQETATVKTQFTTAELLEDYDQLWEDLDGRALWNDIILAPQTTATYAQLMDREPSAAKEGAQGTQESTPLPAVKTDYFPEVKAAYFHFPSFNSQMLNRDADVVADYLTTLADLEVEHIIFDVTGNSGGDDRYWYHNIVSPFGGSYTQNTYIFAGDTAVNRHFYSVDHPDSVFQPLSEFPAEELLPEVVEELGLTHFFPRLLTLPYEGYSGKTVESNAQRWVLVDGFVYSAAESFSIFCNNTSWATLVGTRTLGDGDGVSPVLLALENTGLLVRFSSTVGVNGDGTLNAEYGTAPDIPCIKRETPLDACLRQIRR